MIVPWPVLLWPVLSALSAFNSAFPHSAAPGALNDLAAALCFTLFSRPSPSVRGYFRGALVAALFLTLAVHFWDRSMGADFARPWSNANVLAAVLLLTAPPLASCWMDRALRPLAASGLLLTALALFQARSFPAGVLFVGEMTAMAWILRRASTASPTRHPGESRGPGLDEFSRPLDTGFRRYDGRLVGFFALLVTVPAVVFFLDPDRAGWWRSALAMFRAHPLMGVGPGAFGEAFPGFRVNTWGLNALHAHGFLFEMLAERGLLGTLPFLGLLFVLARRAAAAPRTPWRVALVLALASFVLFDLMHVAFSIPGAACLFWAAAGLLWAETDPRPGPRVAPAWFPAVLLPCAAAALWLMGTRSLLARARAGDQAAVHAGLRRAPWEPEFHSLAADAWARAGRWEEARREVLEALRLSPYSARFHGEAGTVSERLGRNPEALDHFRRAAALLPLNAVYWMSVADLAEGREALDACRVVLRLLSAPNLLAGQEGLRRGLEAAVRERMAALHAPEN